MYVFLFIEGEVVFCCQPIDMKSNLSAGSFPITTTTTTNVSPIVSGQHSRRRDLVSSTRMALPPVGGSKNEMRWLLLALLSHMFCSLFFLSYPSQSLPFSQRCFIILFSWPSSIEAVYWKLFLCVAISSSPRHWDAHCFYFFIYSFSWGDGSLVGSLCIPARSRRGAAIRGWGWMLGGG